MDLHCLLLCKQFLTYGCVKGEWYTFKESNPAIFSFAGLSKGGELGKLGGQLLKKRICSSRSKFFPLRVDPFRKSFIV